MERGTAEVTARCRRHSVSNGEIDNSFVEVQRRKSQLCGQ